MAKLKKDYAKALKSAPKRKVETITKSTTSKSEVVVLDEPMLASSSVPGEEQDPPTNDTYTVPNVPTSTLPAPLPTSHDELEEKWGVKVEESDFGEGGRP